MAKKNSGLCLPAKAHEATAILLEGYYALQEHHHRTPSLEYLEGVAKVRYSLLVVAEVLKNGENGLNFVELLRAARKMCSDREINCIISTSQTDTVGPVVYLLKLIVRQYGMACLKAAAEVHEWIIPTELKSDEVKNKFIYCLSTFIRKITFKDKSVDPFVVYGDAYKTLRESISGAIYGNQMEELSQTTQVRNDVVYLGM